MPRVGATRVLTVDTWLHTTPVIVHMVQERSYWQSCFFSRCCLLHPLHRAQKLAETADRRVVVVFVRCRFLPHGISENTRPSLLIRQASTSFFSSSFFACLASFSCRFESSPRNILLKGSLSWCEGTLNFKRHVQKKANIPSSPMS